MGRMIWSIAWRNIWRNKLRSLIMLSAIAIGLFAGVFSAGFYQGMADTRLKTGIKTEVSHIQIHLPGYMVEKEISQYMETTNLVVEKINSLNEIEGASRRIIAECFFKTAHGTRGIRIIGIEPDRESKVTDVFERIVEGNYLEEDSRIPRILVGNKLREKLKLKLNSKVPVDIVDIHGNFSSRLYKVCGFYATNNSGYDEMTAFVKFEELRSQLDLPDDAAHEIAVYLKPETDLDGVKQKLTHEIPVSLEVKSWREINKDLALITESMDQYMLIFVWIILLALAFGIINTMLMVVLERTKELGMLMAIGMHKIRVFSMIILESVFLSLTGGLMGIAIGYWVIKIFEKRPIVLEMFKGFEQYGYSSEVYTSLPLSMVFKIAGLVVILGVVSAIYPAIKAIRLDPANTIRTE
jgi:ABC-type lipoprotein release transport system permease subunit